MKKVNPLTVFAAIIAGAVVGNFLGTETQIFGITFFSIIELLGKLFVNALMLVVVPLVSSSIITGVAKIGNEGNFKRLGLKTFAFYISTTLIAVLVGLFFVNLISPGTSHSLGFISDADKANIAQINQQMSQTGSNFVRLVLQIIPPNILDAFTRGQMLGLIFFSILFGYAISKIESKPSEILAGFWQGIFQSMILITRLVMKCLPLGVFCLIAKEFAVGGFASAKPLVLFISTAALGLLFFAVICLPLMLKWIGKVSPWAHYKAMYPALITAFSTSSSSATLPVAMECVEKRSGVSNRICSLVMPLGGSINMSGSALYECVGAMFIAQAYGIELSFVNQFFVVFLALLTSIGVAGIPSGSIVALIVILKAMGLPAEGIGMILAVDRICDMCRTVVNVFSDSCCAILVARSEGEQLLLNNVKQVAK